MASKQDILKFISAEGFSSSGYEEQILSKFVAFLEAPVAAPVEEPAPKKGKAKVEDSAE